MEAVEAKMKSRAKYSETRVEERGRNEEAIQKSYGLQNKMLSTDKGRLLLPSRPGYTRVYSISKHDSLPSVLPVLCGTLSPKAAHSY